MKRVLIRAAAHPLKIGSKQKHFGLGVRFLLRGSSDGQDGVVGFAGVADLNVVEAGLVEHAGVFRRRALSALRLHQHVEREHLSHDGTSPVFKQHGLHQQDAAA